MSAMKSPLAAGLVMLALLTGCADYNDPQPGPLPSPNPSTAMPPPTGGDSADSGADASSAPTIGFGSFGPVSVGMSEADAIKTGLLEKSDAEAVDGCPPPPVVWKAPYADQLDLYLDPQGNIATIGTLKGATVKTSKGIGVGSSLAEVQKAYPEADDPQKAGYGQSGVIASSGDKHIGFLFDPAPAELGDDDQVTFIEVTQGEEPSLMRDGC